MKICIIVDDYMPNSIKVAAKMMHELACEYIKQGHQVTVLTPNPYQKEKCILSKLDEVNIISFKSGEIKNISKVKRAINETMLSYKAWQSVKSILKEDKYDLIVYYSPSIFFGPLVKKLKKLWGVPSYLILRDLFPQWAIDQKLIKSGSFIEKYFRYFEKINYEAADKIGLMSQKNLDFFDKQTNIQNSTEVLYNWASNEPIENTNYYKKELEIEDKVVFFYGGNIGHAQDMMNIVRLAQNMRHKIKAHFVLVGIGDEVELVRNSINNDKSSNITLLPSVSQSEFKKMLAEFDIGLFTLHKDHTTHNFPGKLLGYMVQRLPILGSINKGNDLKDIVENANAGLITINGEDDLFLENAIKLLDDSYRLEIGNNASKLLNSTFSVESVSKQILNSLN